VPIPLVPGLQRPDGFFNGQDGKPYVYTVVGVLKDFHFQSLHQKINPLVIANSTRFNNNHAVLAVRIKADKFKAAVSWNRKPVAVFCKRQAISLQLL
jgi:putative ABC transport system permease protein